MTHSPLGPLIRSAAMSPRSRLPIGKRTTRSRGNFSQGAKLMLPSLLAHEIQTGIRHFLTTGFEPSDPLFAGVLQRFADDQTRWLKGPYVQIGLPFRTGACGKTFFANFETQKPGYFHQELAWQRFAADRMAGSVLVA